LLVWGSAKGQSYFLARRTLTVLAKEGDLEAGALAAAARIRLRQQAPGYWLTAFTTAPRFEQPRNEMNTFLTSLLADLLHPLPAAAGVADSVQRARAHLTAQIEANGLVRYHGRPDAPVIGALGCAITPDTDDTALVWRIAPAPDRQRLSAALATLDSYRRDDGLYRTWLAPRSAYQCLDPGRDPNPADVTIQMHLLQLLLAEQLPAGRATVRRARPADRQRSDLGLLRSHAARAPAAHGGSRTGRLPASRCRHHARGLAPRGRRSG
jgi:hypothetical protein